MKYFLHPARFFLIILILLIGLVSHLMYGDCQTSKYHYLVQCFYVPENLPKWMWRSNYFDHREGDYKELTVPNDFTGNWHIWWVDGSWSAESYKNGKRHGRTTEWEGNGDVYFDGFYTNGNRDKTTTYIDGQKDEEIYYLADKFHGKNTKFYSDGRKEWECDYVNGLRHGYWYFWYHSGQDEITVNYNKGKRISKEEFNKDGTLNKKEYYDSKGNFKKRELFEKGKLVKTEMVE